MRYQKQCQIDLGPMHMISPGCELSRIFSQNFPDSKTVEFHRSSISISEISFDAHFLEIHKSMDNFPPSETKNIKDFEFTPSPCEDLCKIDSKEVEVTIRGGILDNEMLKISNFRNDLTFDFKVKNNKSLLWMQRNIDDLAVNLSSNLKKSIHIILRSDEKIVRHIFFRIDSI